MASSRRTPACHLHSEYEEGGERCDHPVELSIVGEEHIPDIQSAEVSERSESEDGLAGKSQSPGTEDVTVDTERLKSRELSRQNDRKAHAMRGVANDPISLAPAGQVFDFELPDRVRQVGEPVPKVQDLVEASLAHPPEVQKLEEVDPAPG